MILELWRPVTIDTNYPIANGSEDDIFAVSNLGRVYNMLTGDVLVEHYDLDETGYVWVNLNSGSYRVDELVADLFICCVACDFWVIRHKDGDPSNNAVWNLCMTLDEDHQGDHLEGCLNCE